MSRRNPPALTLIKSQLCTQCHSAVRDRTDSEWCAACRVHVCMACRQPIHWDGPDGYCDCPDYHLPEPVVVVRLDDYGCSVLTVHRRIKGRIHRDDFVTSKLTWEQWHAVRPRIGTVISAEVIGMCDDSDTLHMRRYPKMEAKVGA